MQGRMTMADYNQNMNYTNNAGDNVERFNSDGTKKKGKGDKKKGSGFGFADRKSVV